MSNNPVVSEKAAGAKGAGSSRGFSQRAGVIEPDGSFRRSADYSDASFHLADKRVQDLRGGFRDYASAARIALCNRGQDAKVTCGGNGTTSGSVLTSSTTGRSLAKACCHADLLVPDLREFDGAGALQAAEHTR